MTAPTKSGVLARIRWSGALAAGGALVALVALAGIGPPGTPARAATAGGYNQITGAGETSSGLTVQWKQGLLNSSNKPITAANAVRSTPAGSLAFMYEDPDYQNLSVTVSQTQDITHQGITVTWSGAAQTIDYNGLPAADFMQLMECYGDSSSGPSPQDCEFGADTIGTASNRSVDTRGPGPLCATGPNGQPLPPSTSAPPASLNGLGPTNGCDPEEPGSASPSDVDPADPTQYWIPFVPVDDASSPVYDQADLDQYFTTSNTNEVAEAVSNAAGDGQVQFQTLTETQAPGLGCGELESNGQARNCWLVIVPRGVYEPNGFHVSTLSAATESLVSSPLSASNWAMRIQIHLDYAAVPAFCPISTKEIETVGTQIVARAVQSWQLALNKAANCTNVYGYSAVPEATSTQQLANSSSGVGLAFTTIPIGSEAARDDTPTTSLPPILYAPVAISAEGFGFNIDEGTGGYISTPIKLTPELLAKSLTQVYLTDLPDYYPPAGSQYSGPSWSLPNPLNITKDQEFQKLNPEVLPNGGGNGPTAPLLTEDHSALNQQIWQWIESDPAASAWLNNGTTSATNPVTAADPDYATLQLGTPPAIDSFPRAYSACLDLGLSPAPVKEEIKCSLDLLPYVNNYNQAAADIVSGNDPTVGGWDSNAVAPDGTSGWWDSLSQEPLGQVFVWGVSDTPDLAAYGVVDAQLCSDTGTNCVGPSTASLTTALDNAKPDSAGLLEVNPADPGAGGYPLTQVTYAAVPTNQSPAQLNAYANLIAYAAGAGQTAGVAPGNLPPGYLPLSASLKAQAMTVVAKLRADAGDQSTSVGTASHTSGSAGSGGSGSASSTSGSGSAGTSLAAPSTPGITAPSAQLAATRTPPQPVGPIRWVLLAVVAAGAVCAVSGTVLRSAGAARWLRRMRP
jgi:hypothetical protein